MARGTLPVLLGVFAVAACTELPTITEAPADGGTSVDAGTPPTDSGAVVDGSVEQPGGDAGPRPDGGLPSNCSGLGTNTPEVVELGSGPAYCDRGWTLVLKANGAIPDSKWRFDSPCWTGPTMCGLPTVTSVEDLKRVAELRTAAFDAVAGTAVRVVVDGIVRPQTDSFVYAQNPTTLRDMFTRTSLSYQAIEDVPAFLPPLTVQGGKLGLMVGAPDYAQVRIGFAGGGNTFPLAWTGVGGKLGTNCFPQDSGDPSPSAGSAHARGCGGMDDFVPATTTAVVYVYVK